MMQSNINNSLVGWLALLSQLMFSYWLHKKSRAGSRLPENRDSILRQAGACPTGVQTRTCSGKAVKHDTLLVFMLVFMSIALGCSSSEPPPAESQSSLHKQTSSDPTKAVEKRLPAEKKEEQANQVAQSASQSNEPTTAEKPTPQTLVNLIEDEENELQEQQNQFFGQSKKPKIDDARAASKGIRKIVGKHLILYTDLAEAEEIDQLPAIFDQAVPQWCRYFEIDPAKVQKWQLTGYLMKERERFEAAGLVSENLPRFLHGYQRGHELWLNEQPSDYYRRHLLLHEGTHGFMLHHLGGNGPPWYSEGMAELLGTHRWQNDRLTLGYFPQDRKETPLWGRIKIVQDAYQAQRGMRLIEIMKYDARAHLRNAPYGWCWAIASFFDTHPQYQAAFRKLRHHASDQSLNFSRRFYEQLKADWPTIVEQWQLFVIELDYGYDLARAAIQYKPGRPLPSGGATVEIQADSGWQSSGIRLEAGVTYDISASGRYQVGNLPQPWWCEPAGVTIEYFNHRPLGMLMGAVRDDQPKPDEITPLASPFPIGWGRSFTPRVVRAGVPIRMPEGSIGFR